MTQTDGLFSSLYHTQVTDLWAVEESGQGVLPETIRNPTNVKQCYRLVTKIGKCYVWKSSQISLLRAFQNL